jgi:glycosyltransferase involved in cell wall biosynthesis
MKILFVTNMYPSPERPAYGAFVWQQAEQLRRYGHVVDVVNILGFQSKLNYLKGAVEVLRNTSCTPYDVVHAHYGLTAFAAACRLNAPLVLTLHGSDVLGSRFERLCAKLISRFADAVIVVSEEMCRHVPGAVIPCGVDRNIFKPYDRDEARARLGWPLNKYVVLFPFDPSRRVKRYDLAEAAVGRLHEEGVPVELVNIFNVENREMPSYYSAADVMLLCSDREGSPTAIKEAMACDLPVVATDVGDVREILSGVPGTRLCGQDPGEIARRLAEVLDTPRNGRFERRAAMAKYDQACTVEKILHVYNRALSESKAKRNRWRGTESEVS